MKPQCFFVYGNHGENPVQLEDYLNYFSQAFNACGIPLRYSPHVVPNEFNLLQESFNNQFVENLQDLKSKHPSTRCVCLATEFVTGNTFNLFNPVSASLTEEPTTAGILEKPVRPLPPSVRKMLPILFPRPLRIVAQRLAPDTYQQLKSKYYPEILAPEPPPPKPKINIYDDRDFWDLRYHHFCRIAHLCEQIWCISADQMEGYQSIFGEKVRRMPLICLDPNSKIQHFSEKDIDILFTGTITPYRRGIIEQLKSLGLVVWVGPIIWSSDFRNNFLARAKICLQIRQSEDWLYPSIMRLHHLLTHGCTVVGEKTTSPCLQEEFIQLSNPAEMVQTCVELLKGKNWELRGNNELQRYYEKSLDLKSGLVSLIRESIGIG